MDRGLVLVLHSSAHMPAMCIFIDKAADSSLFFSFATKSKYYSKVRVHGLNLLVCVCARFYYYPYVGGARYVPSSGVQRGSGTGSDTGGAQDPFTGRAITSALIVHATLCVVRPTIQ